MTTPLFPRAVVIPHATDPARFTIDLLGDSRPPLPVGDGLHNLGLVLAIAGTATDLELGIRRAIVRRQAVADRVCMTPGPCDDCGEHFRPYMVRDEVWRSTGLPEFGALICLPCLQARVGRELVADDLLDAPVNDWIADRRSR